MEEYKQENYREDMIGQINYNKYGDKMIILKYFVGNRVLVEFDNGYKVKTDYKSFKRGTIVSPYDKTVCGVGYLGEGKYRNWIIDHHPNEYQKWEAMLQRCYTEKYKSKHPTYKDCTACEEWLNFQNFAQWYNENYYEVDNEIMCLDKDILVKGNKIYSPNTCIFVPERINIMFTKRIKNNGLPTGVSKQGKKYEAHYLGYKGTYNTVEEAFNIYKGMKEQLIKKVAKEYKKKIPKKLYNAMINYIIEISD